MQLHYIAPEKLLITQTKFANKPILKSARVQSIDLLRGVVMILMALDHVRSYFHADAFLYSPTDLSQTSPELFFTRWITHFCAPVFVFLAGVSAYLTGQRLSKKELSIFLLKRGIWLVFLELVIIYFGWNFDITFHSIVFHVIWMLGVSMIVLAALIHLSLKYILLIGLIIVAGHNLLDNVSVEGNNLPAVLWAILHKRTLFPLDEKNINVAYPLIPWIGVMALGFCLGSLFSKKFDPVKRKKILLGLGSLAMLLFFVLRLPNIYGDAAHWSRQSSPIFSFLSILNTSKYPPSLLYLLMTLGPTLIFLAFTEKVNKRAIQFISVFGRVPMLYYIIHIYLIHFLALLAIEFSPGYNWSDMIILKPKLLNENLIGYGFSLIVVYLIWIVIVIGLYPLCRWYDKYKIKNKQNKWLSYL